MAPHLRLLPLSRLLHSNPTSTSFDTPTVLRTLASYSNDPQRALDFYRWVETHHQFLHSTLTTNILLDILGKSLDFPLLRQTFLSMPSPDRSTFRILFHRYSAAHLVSDALSAFDHSSQFGLRDLPTYHSLIDALCEHRHVIEADRLCFGPDAPFPPDTKIHNMILRGWFKMRWWRRCREFWERMAVDGVDLDLHSYSIYMDILSKSGKPYRAVRLYKEIRKKGFQLDVVAYNTVIQAVGLVNGVDFSIRMYREMMESGCKPNVVTYNTIIKMLCCDGRFPEAYGFLERMRAMGCEPDAITYHCFFRCLSWPKEILCLFERMVKSGCQPRMETYVMLLKKFGRWGFLRPVFIVWRAMEELGCSPDAFAYNALIDALLNKGMDDLARKYDQEMLAKGLSPKPRKELGANALGDVDLGDAVEDNEICEL